MDEVKRIPAIEFEVILGKTNFLREKLIKDYYLTLILYLSRDVEGIYFKGGTAINKIFLNHARLSEDLDFSLTRDEKEVKENISKILSDSKFIKAITEGKNVDGFLRMIIKCQSEIGESEIFIDLNKRAKLALPSEEHEINHFYYPFIPKFFVKTVVKEKCHESEDDFSIIKMFNKAKMLKNRWDKDMVSLIAEPISFQEVIKFLSKHFKLKEEKEKIKKK